MPSSTTGTAMAGISVVRQFCRNTYITRITSTIASISVKITSRIEMRMKRVLSTGNDSSMPFGQRRGEFVRAFLHRIDRLQRVGAGREPHRHAGGGPAVQPADHLVAVGADLDARDVLTVARRRRRSDDSSE